MTYCYPTLSAIEKAYTKTGPSAGYPHMQLSVMYVSGVGSIPMKSRTDIVKFWGQNVKGHAVMWCNVWLYHSEIHVSHPLLSDL